MKSQKFLILILFVLIISSCNRPRFNFDKGIIPLTVVNFSEVNSSYDDYNSDLVISWASSTFSLMFSTNRYSQGSDFDFAFYDCAAQSSLVNNNFTIWVNEERIPLIDTINSPANEYGPFISHDPLNYHTYPLSDSVLDAAHRLFYSSDKNGNIDLFYVYYWIDYYHFEIADTVRELSILNSDAEDGYLCVHNNVVPEREVVYFNSDRDGQFDIYRALSEEYLTIDKSSTVDISKNTVLSSNADDKCPYITNNMMVFTSNRAGGYGGYDLYYSLFDGDSWSAPENLGEEINSEYDEYRPIIVDTLDDGFINDMLIFSSNRTGGLGGYDLYYSGMKPSANY